MSRVITAVSAAGTKSAVEQVVTEELRHFTGASAAVLLAIDGGAHTARRVATDPERPGATARTVAIAATPPVEDALTAELAIRVDDRAAHVLAGALGVPEAAGGALLLPLRRPAAQEDYVLLLAGDSVRALGVGDVEAVAACLAAAGATLGQIRMIEHGARDAARHSALARAAKALNESLDLARVLPRICEEAAAILTADAVAVYRGSAGRTLVLEAAHPATGGGAPDEAAVGTSARTIEVGRPLLTRDIEHEPGAESGIRSALAVPMRWDGEARGVLWVGFEDRDAATEHDLALLESFAELAAVACRNASVHASLAEAARTDGLTGCLNHAALHETLRREMQRSRRTGRRLSIVLVDLDHFKQVNESLGHLMGDEVLRRVGRALREAVRPYDFVARYGGDEFAIVAVDAHEDRAAEIGDRSIARLSVALDEVLGTTGESYATAGVAQWTGTVSSSDLVREADRALLYGKQQGVRGRSVLATAVPAGFTLGRLFAGDERATEGAAAAAAASWPSAVREEMEPLRKRTRQLTLANGLGARLAAMTRVSEIVEAAADEIQRVFGYLVCAVVRPGTDGALEAAALSGAAAGSTIHWRDVRPTDVVERCIADRQPVRVGDVTRSPAHIPAPGEPRSEIAVPIWVGDDLWGALDVQATARDAFEEADVRLLETVADQLGSALRSATLYEQLERAYLRTAEALGAALETKDSNAAEHARSIVRNAEAVGIRLGMSSDDLRDLRYAAAFHDIGKIAVPERILNKPGPLTESEKTEVERHTVVGAQILSDVDFLAGVLPLVRHCHEHWDGGGYPDGLAGDRIPLGAQVILVCDAHDAMTADRPYRRALAPDVARAEIRSAVGRQFDSRVASAFLEAVGGRGAPVP